MSDIIEFEFKTLFINFYLWVPFYAFAKYILLAMNVQIFYNIEVKKYFEMQGMIRIYLRICLFLSHKKCTEWLLYLKNHLWMMDLFTLHSFSSFVDVLKLRSCKCLSYNLLQHVRSPGQWINGIGNWLLYPFPPPPNNHPVL